MLPIPKRHWANIWISKAENNHYYLAAVEEQARVNRILSRQVEERDDGP